MKRLIAISMILSISIPFITVNLTEANNDKYFVVTAYYSPLPDQQYYLTGDYEAEKRLNGQGIRGASGAPVFSGMLAAPKNYTFGTKIYLEGLGIGDVQDRGGAIVNAGNRGYSYDRIDVWVGYGDEGLRRALYWGKRTVKGKFVSSSTKSNLDYNKIPAPTWATKGLKQISSIFNTGVGIKSDPAVIKKLQKLLLDVGMYTGSIDGIYSEKIIDIIYNFQLENGIITPGQIYGAGYWGKSTRSLFLKKYLNGEFDKNVSTQAETSKNESAKNIEIDIFSHALTTDKQKNKLNEILGLLGYSSVLEYQIDKNVVSSVSSPGAGNYGPKTRASLKTSYSEYLENEKIRIEEENRKKELEEMYKHLENEALEKAVETISNIGTPKFGEVSSRVRELQQTLKDLGYFEYDDTAIYGTLTLESIIEYQIDNNIIQSKNDVGAGIVGPKTKASLKTDIKNIYLKDYAKTEGIDLESIASIDTL